jgi:hypothetical protein
LPPSPCLPHGAVCFRGLCRWLGLKRGSAGGLVNHGAPLVFFLPAVVRFSRCPNKAPHYFAKACVPLVGESLHRGRLAWCHSHPNVNCLGHCLPPVGKQKGTAPTRIESGEAVPLLTLWDLLNFGMCVIIFCPR